MDTRVKFERNHRRSVRSLRNPVGWETEQQRKLRVDHLVTSNVMLGGMVVLLHGVGTMDLTAHYANSARSIQNNRDALS